MLAEGVTELRNAAVEPEIMDLICVLQKMGAIITVHTDRVIEIEGVDRLGGYTHRPIPDRIEAASLGVRPRWPPSGDIFVRGAQQADMMTFLNVFRKVGGAFDDRRRRASGSGTRAASCSAVALETDVHPGFMTDWQQPLVVALTQATRPVDRARDRVRAAGSATPTRSTRWAPPSRSTASAWAGRRAGSAGATSCTRR